MRFSTAPLPEARVSVAKGRGAYRIHHMDAFDWLAGAKPLSIHAVVTDPPYGRVEYKPDQLEKMKNGKGGIRRIPPSFDVCQRRPLPCFTVLRTQEKEALREFCIRLADLLMPVLVSGVRVFIATNPLVSCVES
jgi:DNA modification methylase